MKLQIHRNCGGTIKNKKCLKCGKSFGLGFRLFSIGIEEKEVQFDEKEHRKRIKEGRDIFR